MNGILRRVLGWALLWFTSYRAVKRFNSEKCPEYSCRIITEIHANIITVLTCKILFFNGTWPFDNLGLPNNLIEIELMAASLGYFIYDFLWCLYYMTEGPVMLFHHAVSIATISASLYMEVSGVEVLGTIFGSEISSIFLNLRWFIKYYGRHDTVVGMATDIFFVILFVGVRIFLGGYLAYKELSSPAPVIMKLGGSCMYMVNCVFLIQVLSFARYKIKKLSKKSKSTNNHNGKHTEEPIQSQKMNGHGGGDVPNGVRKRMENKS